MTEDSFILGFATLINGIPSNREKIGTETRDIYWAELREVPNDLWQQGIRRCLKACKFFPTIKELGDSCLYGKMEIVAPGRYIQITWERALKYELEERAKPKEIAGPVTLINETPATRAEANVILQKLARELPEAEPKETLIAKILACVGCGEKFRVPKANLWQNSIICESCNAKEAARKSGGCER